MSNNTQNFTESIKQSVNEQINLMTENISSINTAVEHISNIESNITQLSNLVNNFSDVITSSNIYQITQKIADILSQTSSRADIFACAKIPNKSIDLKYDIYGVDPLMMENKISKEYNNIYKKYDAILDSFMYFYAIHLNNFLFTYKKYIDEYC